MAPRAAAGGDLDGELVPPIEPAHLPPISERLLPRQPLPGMATGRPMRIFRKAPVLFTVSGVEATTSSGRDGFSTGPRAAAAEVAPPPTRGAAAAASAGAAPARAARRARTARAAARSNVHRRRRGPSSSHHSRRALWRGGAGLVGRRLEEVERRLDRPAPFEQRHFS